MNDPRARKGLLRPDAVALIGASDSPEKLTSRPQRFLDKHGFAGAIHPVNPRRETVLGRPAYASIEEIPGPVDHAYILLDADPALAALERCAAADVPVVSVLADGFAEAGEAGLARQRRLTEIAEAADMLVIGPNSMGVVETASGFACTTNAAFGLDRLPRGRHAVLSQSGSVIGAILSRGAASGIGFSAYVSVGNEAVAGIGELGRLLVVDPAIDGFVLFLETIRRPSAVAEFAALARAAGKSVAAYLVGRSERGAELAVSHTGAMTGGARAIQSFLEAQDIVLADSFEALIELPGALARRERLADRPRTATVVTTTGGGGGMVYDQLGLRGVDLAGMPDGAARRLSASGLAIKPGLLVDVTLAGARYETMKAVMRELMTDAETGLIVAAIGSSAQFNPELAVRPIIDACAELGDAGAPVVAVPLPDARDSLHLLHAAGVPAFRTVESCAECVATLLRERRVTDAAIAALPPAVTERIGAAPAGMLNEMEAGRIFRDLGIRQPEMHVLLPGEALPERLPFDGPYVAKLVCAGIAHKSEVGAVRVGLVDAAAVAQVIPEMLAAIERHAPAAAIDAVLVQRMERGLAEAIVGLTRDPVVGPIVSVGAGGVLSEIYHDLAVRPAPVSVRTAQEMIDEVEGFAPLRGYRGAPRGDLAGLARAVASLSRLGGDPRVREAEINPVLVLPEGDGVVALDALIALIAVDRQVAPPHATTALATDASSAEAFGETGG